MNRPAHGWILPLQLAWGEVRAHAMRSSVTAGAVFLGVATLLVLSSLSRGMEKQNREMYLRMGGAQILQVTAASSQDVFEDAQFARSRGLRLSDVPALRDRLDAFDAWIPEVELERGSITTRGKRVPAAGMASVFERFEVLGMELDTALDLTRTRWESGEALAVVGPRVLGLRTSAEALGKELIVSGRPVRIAGVFKVESRMDRRGREVAIPLVWYQRVRGEGDPVLGTLRARVKNLDQVARATTDLENELVTLHRGVKDVDVSDNSDLLENSSKTVATMSVVTWAIAIVSLLSGGIGILNVQLSSLASRVRDLGTARALGAPPRLVFRQMLLESLLVASAGGLAGMVVGLAPGLIPAGTMPWQPSLSAVDLVIAAALALGVGAASGILPAWKASRIDPVEAMRA